MAKPARILALDLGMQTVSLAGFHKLPDGGLCLDSYKETELIADPSADATRPIQIEEAVKELAGGLKATKESVNFCLPSQSVFARFVKLPGTSAEDVTGIIGFEAQQNVPFPIDEVVWDYQIMGQQRDGNWDVVLVAMKADQLTEVSASVLKGGLKPQTIDLAPMAVFNAFRYNYPEATGCSLLVDIGARTTNLIFAEGDRVFSRSIPVGGNTISAAVAKEFGQDITLAERLKIERGFVGLGGAYAEPSDPTEARVAKVIRNTMTRLHAEIARSVSFYRTSQAGSQPVRVYLCGGTVSLPYMVEFFGEKLQTPVEFLNPLRNVTVTDAAVAAELSTKAHTVGELVGTALRALGDCPLEINLRPPAVVREHDLTRRKPFLVLSLVCFLCALGVWSLFFNQATKVTEEVLAGVQADVATLEKFSGEIDKVAAEQKKQEALVAPLLVAAAERSAWPTILDELGAKLPARHIWITSLHPMSAGKTLGGGDGKTAGTALASPAQPAAPAKPGQAPAGPPAIDAIEVKGLYLDNPPNEKQARIIDEFVDNLKSSSAFVIGEDKTKVITQRTTPTGEAWAYGFTLVLPLRNPILLP
ncbi:MAG: Amuc_1101 family PilM-like pilus complex protein [Terrimicrobiaceae bacterium]|jgi:type IV pilus assembly protein PilM